MKKYLLLLLVFFVLSAAYYFTCRNQTNTKDIIIETARDNGLNYSLVKIKETNIESDSLFSISDFVVDYQGNYIICDLAGHQINVYDSVGAFIQKLASTGGGPGEVYQPIVITIDKNENLYVSDNATRRISVFNSDYEFKNSFAITAGHIPPITMVVDNEKIYLGGFNISQNNLIHMYNIKGKFLKSFFNIPEEINGTALGNALCYPYFDVFQNNIFATQSFLYQINKYNDNLERTMLYHIKSNNFKKFSEKFKKENIFEDHSTFSKICYLGVMDDMIIIQVEMPRKNYDGGDYLVGSDYQIDIFSLSGKCIKSNIQTRSILMYIDKQQKVMYFLSKLDFSNQIYSISGFKFTRSQ